LAFLAAAITPQAYHPAPTWMQATIDKLKLVHVPGPHSFVLLSNKKRLI
jgi:hypothetical protein